ncbi:tryptophan 7-halogenase [Variovorax dokdonensis]|uniref:Tryptophan 7-halogenase n=1 Tax=Variovorax dokdonensis TaxID=344883 RepID=A0ABT7NF22_9BURK|nr:tryptophan 7-halogenase [Variovorax dokdonensis]MDM0046539.1 tryptophan 7-halogenase [Variovorax dokdonensis]
MSTTTPSIRDVTVLGGGLAGLTLAIQLRRRMPSLDVLVVERSQYPVPIATHKVGESSVEIGAHYFDTVLGLGEHMREQQLRKFGFRFFFCDGERDIAAVREVGASRALPVPSYQIDRGIFENFLADEAQRLGVQIVRGAAVRQLQVGSGADAEHQVTWHQDGTPHTTRTRWLVDASGRAGLLKRKLGLAQDNGHAAHSVWFRVGDRLSVDEWSDDPDWRARCDHATRWLSTNHLVGTGYWVWLIPLASGSHSVGIVADQALHPSQQMDTFDKAMDWLERHQPRLHAELDARRHLLQDFAFLRRFSYGCQQVFSGDRWAMTGEAGLFLDPFYSPGSDFIAIGNTFITDLIARDQAGERLDARAQVYDRLYRSFYESTLTLYEGQYPLFGDAQVMPVKILWDYTYYWGILSQLFFHHRLTDLAPLSRLRSELDHGRALNVAMQAFLRAWSRPGERKAGADMLDHASLPWFVALNQSLLEGPLDEAGFAARIRDGLGLMRQLAREIVQRAGDECPQPEARALLGVLAQPLADVPERPVPGPMLFAEVAATPAQPALAFT